MIGCASFAADSRVKAEPGDLILSNLRRSSSAPRPVTGIRAKICPARPREEWPLQRKVQGIPSWGPEGHLTIDLINPLLTQPVEG